MRKHLILPVLTSILLLLTSFSCNSQDASSITEGDGPVIEARYTLEEVLDIARDFSPECRKRIPPREGSG